MPGSSPENHDVACPFLLLRVRCGVARGPTSRTEARHQLCVGFEGNLTCRALWHRRGAVRRKGRLFSLEAHEVAECLVFVATDTALPEVPAEAGQARLPRSSGQLELHAGREQIEALRAGDLLGLRVEDVSQQAVARACGPRCPCVHIRTRRAHIFPKPPTSLPRPPELSPLWPRSSDGLGLPHQLR